MLVSADSKGLADGQFRPKDGKTRKWLASADSTGVTGTEIASGGPVDGDCLRKASQRREFREITGKISTGI